MSNDTDKIGNGTTQKANHAAAAAAAAPFHRHFPEVDHLRKEVRPFGQLDGDQVGSRGGVEDRLRRDLHGQRRRPVCLRPDPPGLSAGVCGPDAGGRNGGYEERWGVSGFFFSVFN